MRTTIRAIYEQDAEKAYGEFFTEEFATQQLGQPGRWLLLGTRQPDLFDPVQVSQVEKLIERSRGNDAVRQPVAWRLNFEVGRDVTALWAVSPRPMRERIERGHESAVKTALSAWLPSLSESRRGFFEKSPSASFALFTSGTGEGQIPYLHTTAFLFNSPFSSTAGPARLPAEKVVRSEGYLDNFYIGCLDGDLSPVVGRPGSSRASDVPRRLFPPLFEPSLSADKGPSKFFDYGGPFTGEEIFAQWRRQAETRGFGPTQVEAVLRNARQENIRRWASYYQLTMTPTMGERMGQWIRQGRELFRSTGRTSKPLSLEAEKLLKPQSVQQSKKNDMSHSY